MQYKPSLSWKLGQYPTVRPTLSLYHYYHYSVSHEEEKPGKLSFWLLRKNRKRNWKRGVFLLLFPIYFIYTFLLLSISWASLSLIDYKLFFSININFRNKVKEVYTILMMHFCPMKSRMIHYYQAFFST